MLYETINGVIEILKSRGKGYLANLLEESYSKIVESLSFGNYAHSVLSTYEIYSPLKKHISLTNIKDDEEREVLEAVLRMIPPMANSPEITNVIFLHDPELDGIDSHKSFLKNINLKSFWEAFTALISELLFDNGLFDSFSKNFVNTVDGGYFEIDTNKINLRMKQEIGDVSYPFRSKPENETVVKIIEFFFKYAKTPDGDRGSATYEFTKRVNELFKNFKITLKLKKGKIILGGTIVLNKLLEFGGIEFLKKDPELAKLLNESVMYFNNPSQFNIDTALEKISNALERVKTLLNPKNKKQSIENTIKMITNDINIQNKLDCYLTYLTEISNRYSIRHKEKNQKNLDSIELKQFFFFEYFNIINLILLEIDKKGFAPN